MNKLVRLWKRPCKNGREFRYVLIWYDEQGKERWQTLKHADGRKAERQRAQKERELRMGIVEPGSMKLSELLEDYVQRTRTQIEESTAYSAAYRMKDFIAAVGDIRAEDVTYRHCERFLQYCIDRGLSLATVNTHIKMVKRIFSLAVRRGQLEETPFKGLPLMKVPQKTIRLLNNNEIRRITNATASNPVWTARILLAKTAGLRRGEILNLTVNDIDFDKGKVIVQPKKESKGTWRWVVKDKERRELPLVPDVAQLLADIQIDLPDGQPYLLLAPERYQHLLKLQRAGKLIDRVAKCPDNNHRRNWLVICRNAAVENVTFHDLRATCITEWFEQGLMPHEVQRLAGHASIETTMNYYVGIRESMIDRARQASVAALGENFIAKPLQVPQTTHLGKKEAVPSESQLLDTAHLTKVGATGLEPATS